MGPVVTKAHPTLSPPQSLQYKIDKWGDGAQLIWQISCYHLVLQDVIKRNQWVYYNLQNSLFVDLPSRFVKFSFTIEL